VLHFAHNNLPFGGVNNSGIGSCHGIFGFRAFSHERAVLRDRFSVTPMLFPPYTKRVKRLIAWSMKYFA
jgi:aldehyde dehydrogenase (NAD+)